MIYEAPKLQRVFTLERETLIGARLVPLSKYLKDYHGRNRRYRGNMVAAMPACPSYGFKVTPAKAGVQPLVLFWIPVCAGMTEEYLIRGSPR